MGGLSIFLWNGGYGPGFSAHPLIMLKADWLPFSPHLSIDLSAIIDPISVMMIVVVSFISLMVHIFSLGYMKGEERFATYYAFLGFSPFPCWGGAFGESLRDLYFLGTGRLLLFPADRVLLRPAFGGRRG
jgi:NADH:ubiquinone oxidoreductase subunit 5 (subunit L)/multisubunit Na+/H+ antiporter MnhA subunit